jgi:L-ascorbate metabolism protein UlaG (beta-lactamase superfamily)
LTAGAACAIFGKVEITWLGHSCFRLKGSQAAVVADPYAPDIGLSLGKPSARIVTVSHQHPGHNYVQGVSGDPKVIHGPGEYEVGGILIIGIPTYHDAARGEKRGKNTGYLMEIDGITVFHAGDLGHVLDTDQLEEIGSVDVLMLPVGGESTIDAPRAVEIVKELTPPVVIPMHFQTPELKRELAPLGDFLKEMGLESVEPRPKLSVTRNNLPPSTQVVLLSY